MHELPIDLRTAMPSSFKAFLCIFLLSFLTACQTTRERPLDADTATAAGMMTGSRTTEAACAKRLSTVWAVAGGRAECIRYFAAGLDPAKPYALVHFHGDVAAVRISSGELLRPAPIYETYVAGMDKRVGALSDRFKQPVIYIGRPGALGSSGYHGDRLGRVNRLLLNDALDKIKAKHGLDYYTLSGQSGGGTVVADLLTMRRDIRCAALGAAAASLRETIRQSAGYAGPDRLSHLLDDPADRIDEIVRDDARIIYMLGDREDHVVRIDAQRSFAVRARRLGHRVEIVATRSVGGRAHGTALHAITAAALCVAGASPEEIGKAVAEIGGGKQS